MDDLERFESLGLAISALPEIDLGFRIPKLAEKPQDPIIESLQVWHRLTEPPGPSHAHDPKAGNPVIEIRDGPERTFSKESSREDVWTGVFSKKHALTNAVMSWDSMRRSEVPLASPFLSERPSCTLAAARQIVMPMFQDQMDHVFNLAPRELLEYLVITLSGVSSSLHVWNPDTETFHLRGLTEAERGKVLISSMDETTSASILDRFVTIGTLLRRLDNLTLKLRNSAGKPYQHLHAFGHALSSVLAHLRASLARISSMIVIDEADIHALTALWAACADVEEHVRDLAALCGMPLDLKPEEYSGLPPTPSELLSLIYEHLERHLKTSSSQITTAICAFILTSVSENYFEDISFAVGYYSRGPSVRYQRPSERASIGLFDDDDDDVVVEEHDFNDSFSRNEQFPSFFAEDFSQSLLRARRSLKLLQAARPNHPLLSRSRENRRLRWFWSEDEVEAAWLESEAPTSRGPPASCSPNGVETSIPSWGPRYEAAIKAFSIFDLEPGAHLDSRIQTSSSSTTNHFATFLARFPSQLPSLTPTLPMLRDLVLHPLSSHIRAVATELHEVFLSPSAGYLDFRRHLKLLRSYVLLTSPAFKSRLQAALFCDAPEEDTTGMGARSMAVRARASRSSRKHGVEPSADTWVIGLAPALTEGDRWPPGGSDLSFYLRTVIIDALEADHSSECTDDGTEAKKDQLLEEAEWRLGFAIRDLPVASRARWLNPKTVEALDFLYMDYHPPQPLDELITPEVLSKYHRIFAFNLRLMRVENVVKALFRMSLRRDSTKPVFETLTASRRLFLYFRFVAHAFITALSSYVYDTAIGGAFDAFLRSLSPASDNDGPTMALSQGGQKAAFSDVFALAERHSTLLDDILSACLLRGSQKGVGDVLRNALEVVLRFGLLMADLHNGKIEEYEAAGPLEDLFGTFRRRMNALHKGLKAMVDRVAALETAAGTEDAYFRVISGSLPDVAARLHDLLTRVQIPATWQDQH